MPAAKAGPSRWPASRDAPYSALAAVSRSGLTIAGSSAEVAGRNKALPMPSTSASATMATTPSASRRPPIATARITSAAIAQPRWLVRSARAPTKAPRSIEGSRSASSTAVAAQAEPMRS